MKRFLKGFIIGLFISAVFLAVSLFAAKKENKELKDYDYHIELIQTGEVIIQNTTLSDTIPLENLEEYLRNDNM